jgi:hypothetical protein
MQIAAEQVLGNPMWSKAQTGHKDAMNMGTPKAAKHTGVSRVQFQS